MDDLRESHHDHHDRGAPRREAAPEEPGRCAPGRPMTARVRGMASPACAASEVRVAQRSELMERAETLYYPHTTPCSPRPPEVAKSGHGELCCMFSS